MFTRLIISHIRCSRSVVVIRLNQRSVSKVMLTVMKTATIDQEPCDKPGASGFKCCDERNDRFPRSLSSRWNFYNIVIIPIEYGSRKVDFHFSGKNGRKNVTTVRNFYHLTLSHSKRIFRGKKSLMPFIYSNGMINWSTFLQCHFIVRFWATRM